MADRDELLRRMKARGGSAKPALPVDLRAGRPDPPPKPDPGVPCQRCGHETTSILCVFADYWVCPACAVVVRKHSPEPKVKQALVQCWACERVKLMLPGLSPPEELRCYHCGGAVEVLRVEDVLKSEAV
jgi:hypothetical protein